MSEFELFERIVRLSSRHAEQPAVADASLHPFDRRNIHQSFPAKVRQLFDDGHYAEATFAAFKFLDKLIAKHANIQDSGYKLMMAAFEGDKPGVPKIQLTPLSDASEIDEQKGFRFIFAGGVWAIRNPRGHEFDVCDDIDTCLDHLGFLSMLVRRLELAGFV